MKHTTTAVLAPTVYSGAGGDNNAATVSISRSPAFRPVGSGSGGGGGGPALPPHRHSPAAVDPSADRMTVVELRSVAERQRQLLAHQAQQLQAKEEQVARLRATRTAAMMNAVSD